MIPVKNTRHLSLLKKSKNIIEGDRVFHPLIPNQFNIVAKIVVYPKMSCRTFLIQNEPSGIMGSQTASIVGFIHIHDENKIETAARFSMNS